MSDITERREFLLDSVSVVGTKMDGILKLNVHAVLLELFEMRDAAVSQARSLEAIARDVAKMIAPATPEQPDLPLKQT